MKQIYKVPENKTIVIQLPEDFHQDDMVEISINHQVKLTYENKTGQLKQAMKDEGYIRDMQKASNDFLVVDTENWV